MSCTPSAFTRKDLDQLRSAVDRRCAGHLSYHDREDLLGDILLAAAAAEKKTGVAAVKLANLAASRVSYYARSSNRVATIQQELLAAKDEDKVAAITAFDPSTAVDVRELIDRLPPRVREAFSLHEAGLSLQEIARSLSAPISTVHYRITEARRALGGWWSDAQAA